MKFLSTLQAKYETLGLEQPKWLKEYTAPVIATPAAATPAAQPAAGVATATSQSGIVGALNKAMELLGDDPEIQKIKTDMAKKITDAKKQITDTSTKTLDAVNKALTNLQTVANTSQPQTTLSK